MKTPSPRDDYPVCGNCGASMRRCGCDGCGPTAAIAFALLLAFVFTFTFDRCSTVARGDEPKPAAVVVPVDTQPEIPPGTQPQPLVAPAVVLPSDEADDVKPSKDDLKPKPAIVVSIGGAIITSDVVLVEPGQLVEVSPQGAADETLVRWNYSSKIEYKTTRDRGHYLGFTFMPKDAGRLLLVSAMWNGDAGGFAAGPMRWFLVSGKGPQPPPDDVDPPKPDPVTPVVTVGAFRALIVADNDSLGDLPTAQRSALQSIAVMNYLGAKCLKEADSTPAYRTWDDSYTDEQITDAGWLPFYRKALAEREGGGPWVCIWDSTGKLIGSSAFPGTEPDALAYLRKFGGN